MAIASKKTPFLPTQLREQIARTRRATVGLGLVTLSLFLAVALLSHQSSDPSLNTATGIKAQNFMGSSGALISDFFLQTFGYATYIAIPILASWGVQTTISKQISKFWLRVCFFPLLLVHSAATIALITNAEQSSEVISPGGITGHILAINIISPWALGNDVDKILIWLPSVLLACTLFLYLLAITKSEWVIGIKAVWRHAHRIRIVIQPYLSRLMTQHAGKNSLEDKPLLNPTKKSAKFIETRREHQNPKKSPAPPRQSSLDLKPKDSDFSLPSLSLLHAADPSPEKNHPDTKQGLKQNAHLLEGVLQDFGVRGEIVKVRPGPVVTLYELAPAPGTKTSRVISLSDDIARSMSAISVRIATVPGRNVIGIELPNSDRETVFLSEQLSVKLFEKNNGKLPLVLGKDIGGMPVIADLSKMPHLLIAGTTGSGKSVGLNAMILSLLFKLQPEDCRFIMIDPKMLELSTYHDIPHLLAPVVTDAKKAVVALKWTVREMEDRYQAMSKLGVRNIEGYNKRVGEAAKKAEVLTRNIQTGFDTETGKAIFEEQELDLKPIPFIVVVVDEIADLMLVAGKEIEASIQRLAQMARAAGIHLIMATQRPSVDVITGTIKANFPTRISFQVTSKVDSRTILGEQGAEQLLGHGDMLYTAPGGQLKRVHGPFVSDEEVEAVADYLRSQGLPQYDETVTEEKDNENSGFGQVKEESDALYDRAVALVCQEQKASTSFIQRHLQIGYNRAARIMEQMEKQGVVSTANKVGKREILASSH